MRQVLTLERLLAMSAEEAAALLLYRRADGAGALDAPILEQWLSSDLVHAEAWAQACAAWNDFDGGEDDEILSALRAEARRAKPDRPLWRPLAAAAAAVVLAFAGASAFLLLRPMGEATSSPAVVFTAEAGQTKASRLPDGSLLTLHGDSAVTARFAGHRRDVRLSRGHASFEVAHDPGRPFVVAVADQEVVALGTRFDVTLSGAVVEIVLAEGSVSVRPAAGSRAAVVMRPGQRLVVRPGEAPRLDAPAAAQPNASDDIMTFEDVTLEAAAEVFNRHGAGRLIVKDPAVAALRISGRFSAKDLPRFGRSIALLHPVRLVQRGPDTWEIVSTR